MKNLIFVFDRIPDNEGCNFIEVETEAGESVCAGEWRLRDDGLAELVVPVSYGTQAETLRADMAEAGLEALRTSLEAVTLNLKMADDLIGTRTADLLACGTRRKAAEQRVSELWALVEKAYDYETIDGDWIEEYRRLKLLDAALNPKPEAGSQ